MISKICYAISILIFGACNTEKPKSVGSMSSAARVPVSYGEDTKKKKKPLTKEEKEKLKKKIEEIQKDLHKIEEDMEKQKKKKEKEKKSSESVL